MNVTEIKTHNIHRLLMLVLRCKGLGERVALCHGTLMRKDVADLLIARDMAFEQGLLTDTKNVASAGFWGRSGTVGLLYLTKAGKAWLRAQGENFGSMKLYVDQRRYALARQMAEVQAAQVAA